MLCRVITPLPDLPQLSADGLNSNDRRESGEVKLGEDAGTESKLGGGQNYKLNEVVWDEQSEG